MIYSVVKRGGDLSPMATSELSLFSIEILGLVGREGVGPHDLLRMAQRGRMLAWAGESQYYTEPKRLLICDLVGEQVTRESLSTLRDDLADIAARLEEAESRAAQLAHREKYLLLVTGFLRRYLVLHRELIDDVERELDPEAERRP